VVGAGRFFISRCRLARYRHLYAAKATWALDSGGFSELSKHGEWSITPRQYVSEIRRYAAEIGRMRWAAIMDWMCEPRVLAKTRRTVWDHQRLTVHSYLDLMSLAPEITWTPVIQGWTPPEYLRCVDLYAAHGIDLTRLEAVGVGSVCRRQATMEAYDIFKSLHALGIPLHGFGLKKAGLPFCAPFLTSADSLAWSFDARYGLKRGQTCGEHSGSCANCYSYAYGWLHDMLNDLDAYAHNSCGMSGQFWDDTIGRPDDPYFEWPPRTATVSAVSP
jgi:hypothetical protein